MNTLSVCQDEFFISWRRRRWEGGGTSLRRLRSLAWQEKFFGFFFFFFFLAFLCILRRVPIIPAGRTGVVKSTAQLASGIIHPLHLLFSASHFFSFYSSFFLSKNLRLLDWEFSDLQFQPCPQPPVVERETPSPSNRIGQPALTHHCAECLKTCFTRWLGLACVITFEWGLGVGRLPCRSCVVFSKGELRARELLCSGEKRRNSFSAAKRKAVFSGKVKDIECASLSLNILLNGMLAQHTCQTQSLRSSQSGCCTADTAWCLAVFTELTLLKPCSRRCS